MKFSLRLLACAAVAVNVAGAQLRVATWNITNYSSGREAAFQTALYGVYQGRTFAPDVIIAQELLSQTGVNNFRTILNTAPGSPGDWQAAPFTNGPDTDGAFFYRTSKVVHILTEIAAQGSTTITEPPRHTYRHDFRPVGYSATSTVISAYNSHMKAQESGSADDQRRKLEGDRIAGNALTLPADRNLICAGDFNIQNSNDLGYVPLVGLTGSFNDPIKTPGTWENASAFRFVRTQDPAAGNQMDSRFDFLLVGDSLIDGDGMDYIGNPNVAYSTTTWNDPNHSYRVWGNDGSTFNTSLNITTNAMVGPTIAAALQTSATSGGHPPVFMDMRMPSKVGVLPATINLGNLTQNSWVRRAISIEHAGNTALWNVAGLDPLDVNVTAPGLTLKWTDRTINPGVTDTLPYAVPTAVLGPKTWTMTVNSDDPDRPTQTITITANIVSASGGVIIKNPPK